ncbi:MAG: hypothetical protein JSR80_02890 [Verrucomicrobia bacterium]|nr:hypothetical protein [Verrucomicrobiota bacterium]
MTERIEIQREKFNSQVEQISQAEKRAFFWKNFFRSTVYVTAAAMCGSGVGMRLALLRENPAWLGYAFQTVGVSSMVLGATYGWQRYISRLANDATKKLKTELSEHQKEELADHALELFEIHPAPILLKYVKEPQDNALLIEWALKRERAQFLKLRYKRLIWVSLATVALGGTALVVSAVMRRGLQKVFPLTMGMVSGGLVATLGFQEASSRAKEEGKRKGELLDRGVKVVPEPTLRPLLGQIGGAIERLKLNVNDEGLKEYLEHCVKLKKLSVEGITALPDMTHLHLRQLHLRQEGVEVVWEELPRGLRILRVASLRAQGDPKRLLKLRKLEVNQLESQQWRCLKELKVLNTLKIKNLLGVLTQELLEIPSNLKELSIPNLPDVGEEHALRHHQKLVEVTLSDPTRDSFKTLQKIAMLRKLKLKKNSGLDDTSLDWILKTRMLEEVRIKGPIPPTLSKEALSRLCTKDHYVILLDEETKKAVKPTEILAGKPYEAQKVVFKRSGL